MTKIIFCCLFPVSSPENFQIFSQKWIAASGTTPRGFSRIFQQSLQKRRLPVIISLVFAGGTGKTIFCMLLSIGFSGFLILFIAFCQGTIPGINSKAPTCFLPLGPVRADWKRISVLTIIMTIFMSHRIQEQFLRAQLFLHQKLGKLEIFLFSWSWGIIGCIFSIGFADTDGKGAPCKAGGFVQTLEYPADVLFCSQYSFTTSPMPYIS